tara:strand:- start:61 stop:432 length:372 start_codon:yes stop_codon:yes gene_type:complete
MVVQQDQTHLTMLMLVAVVELQPQENLLQEIFQVVDLVVMVEQGLQQEFQGLIHLMLEEAEELQITELRPKQAVMVELVEVVKVEIQLEELLLAQLILVAVAVVNTDQVIQAIQVHQEQVVQE